MYETITDPAVLQQSLIQRSYRDDIPSSAIERFLPLILEQEEEGAYVTPCFSSAGINYLHIRHNNLYRQSLTLPLRVVSARSPLVADRDLLLRAPAASHSGSIDQEEFERRRAAHFLAQARFGALRLDGSFPVARELLADLR